MPDKSKAKSSKKTTQGKARSQAQSRQVAAKNVTREDERFIEEHAEGLSKTTQRAKWIHSADEHEDRPGQSLATRSHEVIQHWAEERGAQPATVPGTDHDGRAGVLRLNFAGYGGRELEEIRLGTLVCNLRRTQARVRVPGTQERRQPKQLLPARQPGP